MAGNGVYFNGESPNHFAIYCQYYYNCKILRCTTAKVERFKCKILGSRTVNESNRDDSDA